MIKYIIKLCLYVTMVAFVYADIPVNFNKFKLKNSFSTDTPKTIDNKYPGQAMLYSAIVPGLGQLYNGHIKKALLFSIVEASCWTTYYVNNEQSKDKKIEYMKFADDEWSFENWMKSYYYWQDDNDYKILFSNVQSSDTLYENIWDGSHHLEFYKTHNGNTILMSTTDSDDSNTDNPIFRDYYNNDFGTWVPDTVAINELINDPNFVLIKDSHYYENIFKYNHFYAGWSDAEEITIYDNDGYLIAKSPKKWKYREMRDEVAQLQRVVSYATSAIMLNHVVSMIDAVWISRKKNSQVSYNIKPIFDYKNAHGIGGLTFSLIW